MNEIGLFSICLAWLLSLLGSLALFLPSSRITPLKTMALKRSCLATAFTGWISLIALGALFNRSDYTNQYVWQFSNNDMPWWYKISAIWGGMDGSMLLWAVFLATCVAALAFFSESLPTVLRYRALAIAQSSSLFFLTVTTFLTNPFRYIQAPFIPPDGNGLNPLLQNPLMAIHPPTLYIGFTLHALPAALAIAGTMRPTSGAWLAHCRVWALLAWGFLTAGITLGGFWAYVELGWGGFWAWDPVENASFHPWLISSAFLHSVMVQEKRGMLKLWNIILPVTAYALTVFGTFLTRSGIVQSVHAFASTDIGWIFLLYLGCYLAAVAFLVSRVWSSFRPEKSITSFFSREVFILLNNLVFTSLCFAIVWGVMFPVFSEALTGEKQAVGIPFFNQVTIPLFAVLLLLMSIGPRLAWGSAIKGRSFIVFFIPFAFALLAVSLLFAAGVDRFYPLLFFGLCACAVTGILMEVHTAIRKSKGIGDYAKRHKSSIGSHLVHLGVVLVTIGITSSMSFKAERDFHLLPGQSWEGERLVFTLKNAESVFLPNYEGVKAEILISEKSTGKSIATMSPEIRTYKKNQETTTEVALHSTLLRDVYLILFEASPEGLAFRLYVNPLQMVLWIGVIVMVTGSLIALVPRISAASRDAKLENIGVNND